MTIKQIQEKYFHNLSINKHKDEYGFKLRCETPLNKLTNIPEIDTYSSIFIEDADRYSQIEMFEHMNNVIHVLRGNRLFLEDIDDGIIKYVFDRFVNEIDDIGFVVQHIIGVGYIMVRPTQGTLKIYNEYGLDDYESKMNEYAISAIAKNEDKYIEDWVKYHYRLGFDHIYLYDNNDPNAVSYADMLKQYVDEGRLTVIDLRGKPGNQIASYMLSYYGFPFKYLGVFDIDEFIWLNERGKYTNIKDFIEDLEKDRHPNIGVALQWRCYQGTTGDVNHNKPIWEIDTKPIDPRYRKGNRPEFINGWPKSIYKNGYNVDSNEHFGWESNQRLGECDLGTIDCYGNPFYTINIRHKITDPGDDPAYIKHYIIRNIENVYYNKYLRGHAGMNDGDIGEDGWKWWQWYHNMNYMTDIVPVLSEHDQLFMRSKGMKLNYTFHPDAIIVNNVLGDNITINNVIIPIICDILNTTSSIYIENEVPNVNGLKQPDYRDELGMDKSDYSFDFLRQQTYSTIYGSHYFGDDPWAINNGLQEPIVINIGFPLNFMCNELTLEETKEYKEWLQRFFNPKNIRYMLRLIIEHPEYFIIPSYGIFSDENCFGWRESLEEWLPTIGLKLQGVGLSNNTFITSLSNYLKIKDYQKKFEERFGSIDNTFIVNNLKEGYTTPYHAYICSYLSAVSNLFYLSI